MSVKMKMTSRSGQETWSAGGKMCQCSNRGRWGPSSTPITKDINTSNESQYVGITWWQWTMGNFITMTVGKITMITFITTTFITTKRQPQNDLPALCSPLLRHSTDNKLRQKQQKTNQLCELQTNLSGQNKTGQSKTGQSKKRPLHWPLARIGWILLRWKVVNLPSCLTWFVHIKNCGFRLKKTFF